MSPLRSPLPYALTITLAISLACGSVQGERAANGTCPEGEVCLDELPSDPSGLQPAGADNSFDGLMFHGQILYDEGIDRLGPIAVGGSFELTFNVVQQGVEVERTFSGWHADTTADVLVPVATATQQVTVLGVAPGTSYVRIVDTASGHLYDRIPIQVVEVDDLVVVNVRDDDRPVLYAGCDEMLGARLFATDADASFRLIDQDISVTANTGAIQPDIAYWDCFTYQVPEGLDEVVFTVTTGDAVFEVPMAIEPLPRGQHCPE